MEIPDPYLAIPDTTLAKTLRYFITASCNQKSNRNLGSSLSFLLLEWVGMEPQIFLQCLATEEQLFSKGFIPS